MAHKERLRTESGVGGVDVASKGEKPTELRREKERTECPRAFFTSVRSVRSTDLWGPG